MADTVSWIATIATIIAASMTASNLGSRITGYGFCVFLVGSLSWLATGLLTSQPALTWTNVVLTGLNMFGIWRWLGRQTRIETGADAAAMGSRVTPGEALFPVSLLSHAPVVTAAGEQVGSCIDAMAGCRSGRIAYVVLSEGGVAGVGETLHRLDWEGSSIEGETLRTNVASGGLADLPALARDRWPAR